MVASLKTVNLACMFSTFGRFFIRCVCRDSGCDRNRDPQGHENGLTFKLIGQFSKVDNVIYMSETWRA